MNCCFQTIRKRLGNAGRLITRGVTSSYLDPQIFLRYGLSSSINLIIAILLYLGLCNVFSAPIAYLVAYIAGIFWGSAIHLKATFCLPITKQLFAKQAVILSVTGIIATVLVKNLTPIFGDSISGILAIVFSATVNITIGQMVLKK